MATKSDWENRNPAAHAAENADQAEFSAVAYGACNLEEGIRDERTADAMDDYDVSDPVGVANWAEADAQYDTATGAIADEVARRAALLRDRYPFAIDGNKIVYRPSRTRVYEFCLAVCQAPSLSEGKYAKLPPAFERLVRDVLVRFVGPGAVGWRTGWPREKAEKMPVKFKALVAKLHRLTGEWCWCPGPGRPDNPSHTHVKDEGLDVVVWKRMPDGRNGHLFFLAQCACGDDWTTKFHDIDVPSLKANWIRPLSVSDPIRVFAVPRHIPNNTVFDDVNQDAGLTMDRARIVLIAEADGKDNFMAKACRKQYEELIGLIIPGVAVARSTARRRHQKGAVGQHSR